MLPCFRGGGVGGRKVFTPSSSSMIHNVLQEGSCNFSTHFSPSFTVGYRERHDSFTVLQGKTVCSFTNLPVSLHCRKRESVHYLPVSLYYREKQSVHSLISQCHCATGKDSSLTNLPVSLYYTERQSVHSEISQFHCTTKKNGLFAY